MILHMGGVATATPREDYDPTPMPNFINFRAGDADYCHCVTVDIVDDNTAEWKEAFTITAIAGNNEIKFPPLVKSDVTFILDCEQGFIDSLQPNFFSD